MSEPTQRDLTPIGPADIDFRPMLPSDIDSGLQLCRLAGWDQVQRDWERFVSDAYASVSVATYPRKPPSSSSSGGFDEAAQIIGTVATIRYGAEFGWIGMLLVHPDVQGRGVGAVLLGHATAELGGARSIRLDATPAGHFLYRKHGFVDEFPLRRMEGRPKVMEQSDPLVQPLERDDLAGVFDLDRQVFGASRDSVLAWMAEGAPEYGFVSRQDGNITGYVVGRHGHEFEHLGPIVAADATLAVELTKACLAAHPGRAFVIDSMSNADGWCMFLEEAGFKEQRPYIRMHRGGRPEFGPIGQQFAILGPEFG